MSHQGHDNGRHCKPGQAVMNTSMGSCPRVSTDLQLVQVGLVSEMGRPYVLRRTTNRT
jgi:hypothetical protein